MAYFPVTHAVFAMLKDKDIRAVVDAVKGRNPAYEGWLTRVR